MMSDEHWHAPCQARTPRHDQPGRYHTCRNTPAHAGPHHCTCGWTWQTDWHLEQTA